MPPLLATMEDFAAARGVTFDPTDLQALIALEGASGLVRDYCNRVFTYVEDDPVIVRPWGTAGLVLPEPPVYEVTAIDLIDSDLTETALVPGDWFVEQSSGIVYRTSVGIYPPTWGPCWYLPTSRVRVTYTHGYVMPGDDAIDGVEDLPAGISTAVMSIASRNVVTTASGGQSVREKHVGTYSVTYGDQSTAVDEYGITASERQVLDRYRIWATP